MARIKLSPVGKRWITFIHDFDRYGNAFTCCVLLSVVTFNGYDLPYVQPAQSWDTKRRSNFQNTFDHFDTNNNGVLLIENMLWENLDYGWENSNPEI